MCHATTSAFGIYKVLPSAHAQMADLQTFLCTIPIFFLSEKRDSTHELVTQGGGELKSPEMYT